MQRRDALVVLPEPGRAVGGSGQGPREVDGGGHPAVAGNLGDGAIQRGIEVRGVGQGGRKRGDEGSGVDPGAAVRQGRIAARELRRPGRAAGIDPAVQVGTDLRADPVAVAVVGAALQVEARVLAVDELLGHVLEQDPVGLALGRPGGAAGQARQPGARHVLGREAVAVFLQHQQGQHRVVDVVVALRPGDLPAAGAPAGACRDGVLEQRHVVTERGGRGPFEVRGHAGRPLLEGQDLQRLAEQATGNASLPGRADSAWIGPHQVATPSPSSCPVSFLQQPWSVPRAARWPGAGCVTDC